MRTRTLIVVLLAVAVGLAAPSAAQTSSAVELDLTFQLAPADGTVDVVFEVQDPGPLTTVQLRLGELSTLEGSPQLDGEWRKEDGVYVADLEETPQASATWTSDARIRAQTLEGEGHTTYLDEEFTVVKAGDMVPGIRYSYRGDAPTFDSELTVEGPDSWTFKGPWPTSGTSFQLDRPLPRGFLAGGPGLEEGTLGSGEDGYRIVRVAGAQEDDTTERILLEARSFLGGIYGETAHERFIVVAPSPMFRGGLGSPAGVFLHDDADANVVAHEMVHAYQGFRFSRDPGEATIWVAEGTAVAHGVLLEVAADVKTRQEARDFLQQRQERAEEEHAVALTSAVYGSGNEQAAYTKGAVVTTALDDRIRQDTGNQYTLSDILRELNRRGAADDGFRIQTNQVVDVIAEVTGHDAAPFFHNYVYDSDVPQLGSVFPGEVAIRILGLDPSPPVAGEPFELEVQVTNLDTQQTSIEVPVEVDGTRRGRLTATLDAGASARASAQVEALDRGSYELAIQGASRTIEVLSPADPSVNVTLWPPDPVTEDNVTVGARIANAGQAPYRAPVTVELDGQAIVERDVDIAAGQVRTVSATTGPLTAGPHEVRVLGPQGELGQETFTVSEPVPSEAPLPGLAAVISLIGLAARLGRARALD
ncbi:hypothetical protein BRD56_08800 [Thermoplasmatales archaeon SW_10_69_26]|nr:MAG: hypothetical protein BRD56_08800 [Thermoplasmatales archaeon SW_10_69_26]